VTTARVHIEEWRFGDERWVFDVGAPLRLNCNVLDSESMTSLLDLWDVETLRGVRYTVDDGFEEERQLLAGVITSIVALQVRFPTSFGGRPIPHSGTARHVQQARGWTGDVDPSVGMTLGFVIDIELSDRSHRSTRDQPSPSTSVT
jgi:hypothetical protein